MLSCFTHSQSQGMFASESASTPTNTYTPLNDMFCGFSLSLCADPPRQLPKSELNGEIVPTAECDYDIVPTPLYQALQAYQFQYALSILNDTSADQVNNPYSSGPSIEQANTWIYRKDPSGELRWRMLPLHAAVIFRAPLDVVERLIDLSPLSPKLPDDRGMLPIHIAFRDGAEEDVIDKLLTTYPESAAMKDRKGRLPHQLGLNRYPGKQLKILDLYSDMRAIAERKHVVDEFEQRYDDNIDVLQKTFDEKINTLQTSHQDHILQITEIHNKNKQQMKLAQREMTESYEKQLSQSQNALEEEVASHQKTKESYEQRLAEARKTHEEETNRMRHDHELEIKRLNAKIDVMNEQSEINQNDMQELRRQMTNRLEQAKAEFLAMKRERDKYKSDIEQLEEVVIHVENSLRENEATKRSLQVKLNKVTQERDDMVKEKQEQQRVSEDMIKIVERKLQLKELEHEKTLQVLGNNNGLCALKFF